MTKLSSVKRIHRHFLYLDGDEVLTSLTSLRGGEVESVLQTSLKVVGGNAGMKFSLFGGGVNFGRKGTKETRREVTLRQTIHSAVSVLLEQLYEADGVGTFDTSKGLSSSNEGLVVQFEARVTFPDRVREVVSPQYSFSWDPSQGLGGLFQRVLRLGKSPSDNAAEWLNKPSDDRVVAFADLDPTCQEDRIALDLRTRYLTTVKTDEFGRRATIVGQIETVADDLEELVVVGGPEVDGKPGGERISVKVRAEKKSQGTAGGDHEERDGRGGGLDERDVSAGDVRAGSDPFSAVHITDQETSQDNSLGARVVLRPLCIFR
jgi:hypothetical protein